MVLRYFDSDDFQYIFSDPNIKFIDVDTQPSPELFDPAHPDDPHELGDAEVIL